MNCFFVLVACLVASSPSVAESAAGDCNAELQDGVEELASVSLLQTAAQITPHLDKEGIQLEDDSKDSKVHHPLPKLQLDEHSKVKHPLPKVQHRPPQRDTIELGQQKQTSKVGSTSNGSLPPKSLPKLAAVHVSSSASTRILGTDTIISIGIAVVGTLVLFFFLRGGSWQTLKADPYDTLKQTGEDVYAQQRRASGQSQSSWFGGATPQNSQPDLYAQAGKAALMSTGPAGMLAAGMLDPGTPQAGSRRPMGCC